MLTPHSHTTKEIGIWKFWPEDIEFIFAQTKQRSETSVSFGKDRRIEVHSIAFDSPLMGYNHFLRWDCINGFNN